MLPPWRVQGGQGLITDTILDVLPRRGGTGRGLGPNEGKPHKEGASGTAPFAAPPTGGPWGLFLQHCFPSPGAWLTWDRRLGSPFSCGLTPFPPGILMEHLPLEVWTETRELARIHPQSRSGVRSAGPGAPGGTGTAQEGQREGSIRDR